MLLAISKPLGLWFGAGGVDMEEGSVIDRTVLSALFFIGLLILIKRHFNWTDAIKKNPWVVLLIGYMFVSILWSDMPYISFKRWIRQLVAVTMVFLVATEPEPRHALQSLFRRVIYVLIPFSYILIHYFPEYGREYGRWSGTLMWVGVASQKNGLALLCLLSIFFLVWTLIRRCQGHDIPVVRYQTPVEIFLLFLAFLLFTGPQHTFTYSATSTATLAVGLTALVGLFWLKRSNVLTSANTLRVIILIMIVYGTITPFIGQLALYDPSSVLGRDETLTGRSDIWAILVPYALRKPIWGHGVGGFWTDAMREATSSHAHNGYLDIILDIGFVGHILFSIFFLSCCGRVQKLMARDFDWGVFGFCFLLMAVVHNIAESSTVGFTGTMAAVIVFLAVTSATTTSYTPEVSNSF